MPFPGIPTYDEPGLSCDEYDLGYDGGTPIYNSDVERVRRRIGGSREDEEYLRRKKRHYTSIVIQSELLTINGYSVEKYPGSHLGEIRYAGEDDDLKVEVRGLSTIRGPDPVYLIEVGTLGEAPVEVLGALEESEALWVEEDENALWAAPYQDPEVSGRLIVIEETEPLEKELFILSCYPVTKTQ